MVVEVEGFLREGGAWHAMPFTQQQGIRPQRGGKSQEGSGRGSWWAGLNLFNELQH